MPTWKARSGAGSVCAACAAPLGRTHRQVDRTTAWRRSRVQARSGHAAAGESAGVHQHCAAGGRGRGRFAIGRVHGNRQHGRRGLQLLSRTHARVLRASARRRDGIAQFPAHSGSFDIDEQALAVGAVGFMPWRLWPAAPSGKPARSSYRSPQARFSSGRRTASSSAFFFKCMARNVPGTLVRIRFMASAPPQSSPTPTQSRGR